MKILVDTSVWADFFNDHPSAEAEALVSAIEDDHELASCGVIMAEFFQGIRDRNSLEKLERHFRRLKYLRPHDPESYLEAASLFRQLRRSGVTIRSTIDCLIAVLAAENDAYLLAKDKDFKHMWSAGLCPAHRLPMIEP